MSGIDGEPPGPDRPGPSSGGALLDSQSPQKVALPCRTVDEGALASSGIGQPPERNMGGEIGLAGSLRGFGEAWSLSACRVSLKPSQ